MTRLGRAACLVASAASLLVAAPETASAEEMPACRIGGLAWLPPGFDYVLQRAAAGPVPDARRVLGPQFAFFWGQARDGGWYVGLAPGPVSLDAARAYLLERVDAHYAGRDAELLRERLHVVAQPYGEAELRAIQEQLMAGLARANWGVGFTLGAGCRHSDAFRLELELFNDSSDSVLAAARQLAAGWGDRVIVTRLANGPPRPSAAPLHRRPRLADLLVQRPCERRSTAVLRVRRSARATIERVTVTLRGRRRVFRGRLLSRPLRIRLKPGAGTIRVAVRLRDGNTLTATRRLRRCRRS